MICKKRCSGEESQARNKDFLSANAIDHALMMLAFMPQFRSEHHEHVERLYLFLAQPLPRQEPAQMVGTQIVMQPHLVLGDLLPHRNVVDSDVPFALMWMETHYAPFARLIDHPEDLGRLDLADTVPSAQIEVDDDAHVPRFLPVHAIGVNSRWRRSTPRSMYVDGYW